jgi:hypothetical protein
MSQSTGNIVVSAMAHPAFPEIDLHQQQQNFKTP